MSSRRRSVCLLLLFVVIVFIGCSDKESISDAGASGIAVSYSLGNAKVMASALRFINKKYSRFPQSAANDGYFAVRDENPDIQKDFDDMLRDISSTRGNNSAEFNYWYASDGKSYILLVPGPTGMLKEFEITPEVVLQEVHTSETLKRKFIDHLYDPTNGAISSGNLVISTTNFGFPTAEEIDACYRPIDLSASARTLRSSVNTVREYLSHPQ